MTLQEKKPLYVIDRLQKYYVSRSESVIKAIDQLSLNICSGEFITILGPSGSGKTTLLNLLSGLDTPSGGHIYFEDKNMGQMSDDELCDLRCYQIGIIFQFYNMHPSFSAQENIEYPLMIANIPLEQRQKRSSELLKLVDLEKKKDNYPAELSGGEKQRIGIARALANNPKVIIADEPTGDLDSENAQQIMKYLININSNEGKTIIMVTHDEEILIPSMRILHLRDGKIVES